MYSRAVFVPVDYFRFLQKWERPDNAVIGIIGDFDAQAMLRDVQDALGDWQAGAGQPAEPPKVRSCAEVVLVFVMICILGM